MRPLREKTNLSWEGLSNETNRLRVNLVIRKSKMWLAVVIDISVFLLMLFVGAQYLSTVWFLAAVFFIFLPISNYIATRITGVNVFNTLFR